MGRMNYPALAPLQIGPLRVEWPVFLAPMAGYTDAAFRSLCFGLGCGGAVTEMVNAYGYVIGHDRTEHYLDTWEGEHPLGAQIYGSDPGMMAEAARQISMLGQFDFIDINAGCPMPKIRNRGDGAGLIRTPEKLHEIVRQCVAAVEGRVPVTLKTRVGWDADTLNALELTAGAEEAGAAAIFLHGRVAVVKHAGPSDWGLIGEVKRARRIPVIGNGGVKRPVDAFHMVAETGVDGVMVGRATLGNPWWFRELRELAAGTTVHKPRPDEIRAVIREHLAREENLMARRGPKELKLGVELTACLVLRAHLVRYLRGFRGIRLLAVHLEERQTKAELLSRIDEVIATGLKTDPLPGADPAATPTE